MDKTKKSSSFWDRIFDRISPLRCLQFSMIAVLFLMFIGIGSGVMWGLNYVTSASSTYEYKTVNPTDYVQKNGVSVLSYNQEQNIATVMMSEDVVNTVLNAYLEEQEHVISDVTIYEMVWRQKDNHFYFQLQSGLFQLAVKATGVVTYNPDQETIDVLLGKLGSTEQGNVLTDFFPLPKLEKISIPVSLLKLDEWKKPINVAINSNEMLFEYSPDLPTVGKMIKSELEPEEVYLAWSYSLKNATERSTTLKRVLEGDDFTDSEVKDILHILIDDQDALSSWMAMLTDDSQEMILKTWGIDSQLISQELIQRTRDVIKERACMVYGTSLFQRYKEHLNDAVGLNPDPIITKNAGLDNSIITFLERDRLINTAIITSGNTDSEMDSDNSNATFAVDRGVVYDYSMKNFVDTELIQTFYPSDFPYISELGTFRLYYLWEEQKPVVLVLEEDGTVIEISDSGTHRMMSESAERFVPGFSQIPSKAQELTVEDEALQEIMSTVSRFFDQGGIYSRYCLAADNYAFLVFSTKQQSEMLRSAVLVRYEGEWSVLSLDVSDYEAYKKEYSLVNSTIFPREKISDITIRTIPQEGLNLLLDKARQINLAMENDVLDFYYYFDHYVYTRFSNGKDCVFETDDDQVILSVRSLESARANWDLPAFFVIQAQQIE